MIYFLYLSNLLSDAARLKGLSNDDFLEELNRAFSSPSKTDKWSLLEPNDGLLSKCSNPSRSSSASSSASSSSRMGGPFSSIFGIPGALLAEELLSTAVGSAKQVANRVHKETASLLDTGMKV